MEKQTVRKSLWGAVISIILVLIMALSANAAVRTGGIDVGLSCYEKNEEGKRTLFERQPELMPNQRISYILTVDNKGSDAWVRLAISYKQRTRTGGSHVLVNDSWLYGISSDWVKKGQYWYYKKPLLKGEEIEFCQGIQVPDINDLPQGMYFSVIARAEAVQMANNDLDFESAEPFNGLLIEGNTDSSEREETVNGFEIRYENGADTIVHADSLFKHVNELIPGDVAADTVQVENNNAWPVRLIIKESGQSIDDVFWKVLDLTIRRNGTVIYRGALADPALEHGIVLGEIPGKTKESFEFELVLSEDAKNETAFRQIPAAMTFLTERVIRDIGGNSINNENEIPEKIAVNVLYSYPDPSVSNGYADGEWRLIDQEKHAWEYVFKDGSKAKDGWLYLFNPYSQDENKNNWFCFDKKGIMQFGWIRSENQNWYFCHEISDGNLGKLKRGWHYDADDKQHYYLDPVTGIMQTGWRIIDGNYYYFTPMEQTGGQSWFWDTGIGRWLYKFLGYRTYGSMYKQERTPDGYEVDENGIWKKQESRD